VAEAKATRLAIDAARVGGTLPAVLNAANEAAVSGFLAGSIRFSGIWHIVEGVMGEHAVIDNPGLSEILAADSWARNRCAELLATGL